MKIVIAIQVRLNKEQGRIMCKCDQFLIIFSHASLFYGVGEGCLSVTFEVEHIMYGKWREPQYAQSYLGKVYKTVPFIRYKLYPNIAKVFGQVHQVIYDFFQKRMSTEMWITHHIPKKYALHHFSLLVCTTNFVG